jgi:uncharacterized protein YdcH (DUF465 family)
MFENRIKHLEEAHRSLDKRIDGLESTGVFDDMELEILKKQRLLLKDKIAILKHRHSTQSYTNDKEQKI